MRHIVALSIHRAFAYSFGIKYLQTRIKIVARMLDVVGMECIFAF